MQFALPTIGSLVLLFLSLGVGIAALVNARHQNQIKHHEIDPPKPRPSAAVR